jgi:hypothetical protein
MRPVKQRVLIDVDWARGDRITDFQSCSFDLTRMVDNDREILHFVQEDGAFK